MDSGIAAILLIHCRDKKGIEDFPFACVGIEELGAHPGIAYLLVGSHVGRSAYNLLLAIPSVNLA